MKNLTARILTVLLPSVLLLAGTAHGQYASANSYRDGSIRIHGRR